VGRAHSSKHKTIKMLGTFNNISDINAYLLFIYVDVDSHTAKFPWLTQLFAGLQLRLIFAK
jgi:hypothetical protein